MTVFRPLREACGVCGVAAEMDALHAAVAGVRKLQHRGQDSWGAAWHDGSLHRFTAAGLVPEHWPQLLPHSRSRAAIAHVRYATSGGHGGALAQPVTAEGPRGVLALAHNGNLTNHGELAALLGLGAEEAAAVSDSSLAVQLLAASAKPSLLEAVAETGPLLKGAYSLLVQEGETVIALRDPQGFRPLALGRLPGGYMAASESGAFAAAGGSWLRSLVPGEVVKLSASGIESFFPWPPRPGAQCAMELVYFASRDGMVFGEQVARFRRECGKRLAALAPVPADLVAGVPATGLDAAAGYASAAGLPLVPVLQRSAGSARSFIEPTRVRREQQAAGKYRVDQRAVAGRRVVLVDDSLVRGTTVRFLTGRLYRAGAREVHWRIASPAVISPCYYGTDFPSREELWSVSGGEPAGDSLAFLGFAPFLELLQRPTGRGFCTACFSGSDPCS